MKTILASRIALGLFTGAASPRTVFDQIRDSASSSVGVFGDLQNSAPRSSVFDDLRISAPKSSFEQIRDAGTRLDAVVGGLQRNAP